MSDAVWHPLLAALDELAAGGRTVEVWLRDDDAVRRTAALDRLTDLCERHALPVLLAVIPEPAGEDLASFVGSHPILLPTQHGYRHANHAAAGERARELGGQRSHDIVVKELGLGRAKLAMLFGARSAGILVPPWNRIEAELLPGLPALGFAGLSTFGAATGACVPGLKVLNCDLDIIDWRNGRVGRPHDRLAETLADLVRDRQHTRRPIGLLTHHLAHDDTAWGFLETCLDHLGRHPAVRFTDARALLGLP